MTRFKDLAVQLTIVTAGVFIALFVDSLVEWNQYRRLVQEAHATLTREMTDNKREIGTVITSIPEEQRAISEALKFADEVLASGKSAIHSLKLNITLADLTAASWQTAERTGALAHMDYSDVQQYSRLYTMQELVAAHQRRVLERLASTLGILGAGAPAKAPPKDLEVFRLNLLQLRSDLLVIDQLAKRLDELYAGMLARNQR